MSIFNLPTYTCHKQVQAAKIINIVPVDNYIVINVEGTKRVIDIHPEDEFWKRMKAGPRATDMGYYVVYEDGFTSWSPSEPFEKGYTKD